MRAANPAARCSPANAATRVFCGCSDPVTLPRLADRNLGTLHCGHTGWCRRAAQWNGEADPAAAATTQTDKHTNGYLLGNRTNGIIRGNEVKSAFNVLSAGSISTAQR